MNLKEAIEQAHCRKGEADGTTKYADREVLIAEKRREDRLRALGLQVVRWTWQDLARDPWRLQVRLGQALNRPRPLTLGGFQVARNPPSVSSVRGNVKKITTGRTTVLAMPSSRADNRTLFAPVNETPLKTPAVAHKASAMVPQWRRNWVR